MIVGFEQADITHWKADLHAYQQRKRTFFPSQKEAQRQFLPTNSLKAHQRTPEPSLNKYQSTQLPSREKEQGVEMDRSLKRYMSKQFNYDKPYDIITLHPLGDSPADPPSKPKQNHVPVRNIYNLINGERLSDDYLKDRHIVLPKQYPKKELDRSRDFNIVNLEYKQDNTARQQQEEAHLHQEIAGKCAANHVYDHIYNRYYNPEEEERYWAHKKEESIKKASQNFDVKLPPTYQTRQRYIQDYSKPLPESVKRMDQRQQAYIRSHQAKFLFQERYQMKNVEDSSRKEAMVLRRFNRNHQLNKSAVAPKIKSFGFD